MSKFSSSDKYVMNTSPIEIYIKEEQFDSTENDIKYKSVNHQNEVPEICSDIEKPCNSKYVKIEVEHEETFEEVHGNDHDLKADMDVKIEDEELIEDRSYNLMNDVIPNHSCFTNEEISFSQIEEPELSKVVVQKLNVGVWERNVADTNIETEKEPKFMTNNLDNSSLNFSKFGIEERGIIERSNDGNAIKDFEFRKRIKTEAKFECSLCECKTNVKHLLKSHLLVHSTVKLFKCSECDYECNRKESLKTHLLSHSNTKLFKCSECDYEGNDRSVFKRHLLTHSNMKLFKCPECNYACNRKVYLKSHLLSHMDTKFKCPECNYECNRKGHLRTYLLSHLNTTLFKCSECEYEGSDKGTFKRHLLTHSKTKLFKCTECDYECNQKIYLRAHLLTHSNVKSFKCSECGHKCKRKADLKIHLLTHSTTKLFKCSQCDYESNYKNSLKIHLLTHSNNACT